MDTVIKPSRIAVIMTCFNRKEKTLACLDALYNQEGLDSVDLQVFLVDDGCTDGTGDAVGKKYPQVKVLQGDGSLYWNGGMRLAFAAAMKRGFDYYLWLNDDSLLYPDSAVKLVETAQSLERGNGRPAIIVGAMQDPVTKEVSYSGNVIKSWYAPLSYRRVVPQDSPVLCDAINGNCVLIPHAVAEVVGNLSKEFTHGGGDYDYSLRAKQLGFLSYVAPGYVGSCAQNTIDGTCRDAKLSIEERKKILERPTSLPPAQEWMLFARRHAGIFWPLYWLRTALRRRFPTLWLACRSKSR